MSYEQLSESITVSTSLSASDKALVADNLAAQLRDWDTSAKPIVIEAVVDGRALACPMPLLKTKVALRGVSLGESVYVLATDSNSKADIRAFCDQSLQTDGADNLQLLTSASSVSDTTDTIFHFIITKTGSN